MQILNGHNLSIPSLLIFNNQKNGKRPMALTLGRKFFHFCPLSYTFISLSSKWGFKAFLQAVTEYIFALHAWSKKDRKISS
jgi:hypothetical protein